jgi:hypothetical protein
MKVLGLPLRRLRAWTANGCAAESRSSRVLAAERSKDGAILGTAMARALSDELSQTFTHPVKLGDSPIDIIQFRLSGTFDLLDVALRGELEKRLDLTQRKSECLRTPNEAKSGDFEVSVAAVSGRQTAVRCQQSVALVVPHSVDTDACAFRQLADPQFLHDCTYAA